MSKVKKIVLCSLAVFSVVYGQERVFSPDNTWKEYRVSSEAVEGGRRIQVIENASGGYGFILKYLPRGNANEFLQVEVGDMESALAAPFCTNQSTRGGMIGKLYSGFNTFSLPAHITNGKGNFAFALATNRSGKNDRPWVDFKQVRFTKEPLNTPIVTLVSGETAQIGSKIKIELKPQQVLLENPEVEFYIAPMFIHYQFNKEKKITLQKNSNGKYSAEITIDKDALSFDTNVDKKMTIMAVVKLNKTNYYTLPFPIKINTEHKINYSVAFASSPEVKKLRELWFERIKGVDLARGKKLSLSPKPNYWLTQNGNTDETDLTRGKITLRRDDKIWFDKNAVGWISGGENVYLRLDLGKVEPVSHLVIRLLGGTEKRFKFPASLNAYVSKDGKTYHETFSMKKLVVSEKEQTDWKKYYYLEENGSQYDTKVYPFVLDVQADARYVIINITSAGTSFLFSDALACIKAENKGKDYNAVYSTPGKTIPMEGLIIRPRLPELAIISGLVAPQKFQITDLRTGDEAKQTAELVLELPQGVSASGMNGTPIENNYTRYIVKIKRNKSGLISPIFYLNAKAPVSNMARIYGRSGKVDYYKTSLPIKVVNPPKVEPFKQLHISLSWMPEKEYENFPNFLKNWRHFGFNAVASFPRQWMNSKLVKVRSEYAKSAHAAGYKIAMQDSTFHEMVRGHKPGSEIYCQIPGRTHTMLCPSYRGKFYQKEMERVSKCVQLCRPDYVFYDIEIWHHAHNSAPACTRCQEEMKKRGKDLNSFLFEMGAEMIANTKQAVATGAKEAGIPMPLIGSYSRQPLRPKYGIEEWSSTYPASLDMAQPSLYVSGNAHAVHDTILGNHRLLGNKKIIPWLTAGCYGEFDSYKMEAMVLESLLNGAGGITYYCFDDFTDSPLDFYYHLKALAQIRPYEDLIVNGKVDTATANRKEFTCSLIHYQNEALLLIGNYENCPPEAVINLPFEINNCKDLRGDTGKVTIQGKNLSCTVPKSQIRLFHLKLKK